MNISERIMHFRSERAKELEIVASSIEKNIESGACGPIQKAISFLRDSSKILPFKNGSTDRNTWGYEINNFEIKIPNSRHLVPSGLGSLSLMLDMRIIADCENWQNLMDPLRELYFKVVIRGIGDKNYYSGFHLDKHTFDNNGEIHPIYHLQHLVNPHDDTDFQYGSVLGMDTPRIMHYPLDFVLGIGYLTANFFPLAYETLLDDGFYYNLYREYQERLWKPYIHTLAGYWKPFDERSISWNPKLVCPFLVD